MAALLALALPGRGEAGGTGGATPFDFLFIDASARPVALGGAYAALSQDANALLYNPAGLGQLREHHVTVMHNQYFDGLTQEYAAFAYKIGKEEEETYTQFRGKLPSEGSQGWGLMIDTLSLGKVQRTTLSNPDGSGLGTFGVQDWAVSLGYGRKIGEGLSLGAAIKGLYEKIDKTSANAPAADLGALYNIPGFPLSLGLAVQNLSGKVRYKNGREDLPANLKAGLAYRWIEGGVIAFDVNKPRKGTATAHAGFEYTAFKRMAVRFGYNGRNDAGPGITMGFGVILPGASIDYAFVPFGDLGNSHRISLSLHW